MQHWRMENVKLCNERRIQQREPHMIIQTDASTKGCGGHTTREFPQGEMVKRGETFSHKCSIITGITLTFAVLTFKKNLSHLTIHVQADNKVTLENLLKMGGTCNSQLLKISKSIWKYLLSHQTTNNAEYLPSKLNLRADWESNRLIQLETYQKVFLKKNKLLRTSSVDLFASRPCYQLPQYMAWKPDPNSFAADAMKQDWNNIFGFASLSFSLTGRVKNMVLRKNVEAMILVTSTWQTQPWCILLLRTSIQSPLLLPALPNLLLNPLGKKLPLVKTRSLRLMAWKIRGKTWKCWSQTYLHVQKNRFYCKLRIGLKQVG